MCQQWNRRKRAQEGRGSMTAVSWRAIADQSRYRPAFSLPLFCLASSFFIHSCLIQCHRRGKTSEICFEIASDQSPLCSLPIDRFRSALFQHLPSKTPYPAKKVTRLELDPNPQNPSTTFHAVPLGSIHSNQIECRHCRSNLPSW